MSVRKYLAAGVISLVGASSSFSKDWTNVTIGTEARYTPWVSQNHDGSLEGFDIDLTKTICARAKMNCNYVVLPWDDLIPSLYVGKIDVIFAGLSITDERAAVISFSQPYALDEFSFIVAKGGLLTGLDGVGLHIDVADAAGSTQTILSGWKTKLAGKTIVTQTSTPAVDFVHKFLDRSSAVLEAPEIADVMKLLLAGKADAAFVRSRAATALAQPEFAPLVVAGASAKGDVLGRGTSAAIRQSDTDLKRILDRAVAEAIADGTIPHLSKKWFGVDLTPH